MSEPKSLTCPKCGAPLETAEVMPGAIVHACPACFGAFYSKGELAVPVDLAKPKPAPWSCPVCADAMETGTVCDGHIELDRCPTCGGLWFDAGELDALRRLTGVEQLVRAPGADGGDDAEEAPPKPDAPPAKPAASAKPAVPPQKRPAAPARRETTDDDPAPRAAAGDGPVVPPEMSGRWALVQRAPAWVKLGGLRYDHFQTSIPVTTHVLGEFPWVATVGDTVEMSDFVLPPFLLSRESTDAETVWTLGEYVEPEEVWDAFKLPGAPPARRGVAAAQPNPRYDDALWMTRIGVAAAALCALAYFAVSSFSLNQTVADQRFHFTAADPEKSRVSDFFQLGGRTSNVELLLETDLNNHWGYFDVALINADTDVAYDFGDEIEYYHGVDDGEAWSEGAGSDHVIVPQVPPGRYYLRVEPETDAPALDLNLHVVRDIPLLRLVFIALALLAAPLLLVRWRAALFENARWMESDHPRTSSSEDDE